MHPELDSNEEFQAWIAKNTDKGHQFFDDSSVRSLCTTCFLNCSNTERYFIFNASQKGFIRSPEKLPGSHPGLAEYFTYADEPVEDYLKVYFDHPNLQEAFLGEAKMPFGHPSAHELVSVNDMALCLFLSG